VHEMSAHGQHKLKLRVVTCRYGDMLAKGSTTDNSALTPVCT
jgi:hypothetical protein